MTRVHDFLQIGWASYEQPNPFAYPPSGKVIETAEHLLALRAEKLRQMLWLLLTIIRPGNDISTPSGYGDLEHLSYLGLRRGVYPPRSEPYSSPARHRTVQCGV